MVYILGFFTTHYDHFRTITLVLQPSTTDFLLGGGPKIKSSDCLAPWVNLRSFSPWNHDESNLAQLKVCVESHVPQISVKAFPLPARKNFSYA